jgi:WD40 repeat protein
MVSSRQASAQSLAPGSGLVSSLAFSPDGEVLAAGSGDGSLILWDMQRLEPIGESLTGHERLVRALAFSPDGQLLASGGDDRRVILRDMRRDSSTFGEQVGVPLTAHDDWVTSLSFNADGDSLTSAGKDGRILLWDLSNPLEGGRTPPPQTLAAGQTPIWSLSRSPDERWLVTGGEGDHVTLWDASRVHPLADSIGNQTLRVDSLAFSPDSQELAIGFTDRKLVGQGKGAGLVDLWHIATGQPILQALDADPWGFINMAFSMDGKVLATIGGDNLIYLWDIDSRSETFGEALVSPLSGHLVDVGDLSFHPNGKVLVSGGEVVDNVMFWDADPDSTTFGGLLAEYEIDHKSPIQAIYFSKGGDRLIFRSNTEVIFLNLSTGSPNLLQTVEIPALSVYPPNLIASVQDSQSGNQVGFFDLDSDSPTFGESLGRAFEGFEGRVWSAEISPDGGMLASTDNSGQLRIWDVSSRQPYGPPLMDVEIPAGFVIRFSPDGHSLASGDVDGNVILWDMELESWLEKACQRANRNLTREEWNRYFGDQPYRATCPDLPLEPET